MTVARSATRTTPMISYSPPSRNSFNGADKTETVKKLKLILAEVISLPLPLLKVKVEVREYALSFAIQANAIIRTVSTRMMNMPRRLREERGRAKVGRGPKAVKAVVEVVLLGGKVKAEDGIAAVLAKGQITATLAKRDANFTNAELANLVTIVNTCTRNMPHLQKTKIRKRRKE